VSYLPASAKLIINNKIMILKNKGAAFKIPFDGKDYTIPEGNFEVGNILGNHIMSVLNKPGWKDHNVKMITKSTETFIKPEYKAPEVVLPPVAPEEQVDVVADDVIPNDDTNDGDNK
jgi:hypothetical protein